MNGNAALVHHQAARGEYAGTLFVEGIGKQYLAHADRVGAVHDDHVEARIARCADVIYAVAHDDLGTRIVPGVSSDVWKERFRQPDYLAVDLDHHSLLDVLVQQNPAEHAAIASTDDQYVPCVAMGQQWHMAQHLLVDELVAFGDLDAAVQHHDTAVGEAVEDDNVLECASHTRHFVLDAESLSPVGV